MDFYPPLDYGSCDKRRFPDDPAYGKVDKSALRSEKYNKLI